MRRLITNSDVILNKYHSFTNKFDVNNWVSLNYSKEQIESLIIKNDLESPLAYYKGSCYGKINKAIREGNQDSMELFNIPSLQNFLLTFSIPNNIIVYRFVDIKEFLILNWNTLCKKTYYYPGFLSTTLLKDEYGMDDKKKERIAIKIYVEKNCKGTYIPEVNPEYPEFEILFSRHISIKKLGWKQFIITNTP